MLIAFAILFLVFLGAFVVKNRTLPGSTFVILKPKEEDEKHELSPNVKTLINLAPENDEFTDVAIKRKAAAVSSKANPKPPIKQPDKPQVEDPLTKKSVNFSSDELFKNAGKLIPATDETGLAEQSELLSKEAATLKKSDLNEAISLLTESIRISPFINWDDRFKLAHYMHLNGQITEAYEIYNRLLESLDPNNILLYNAAIANITEKICTRKYKDKEYKEYLFYYTYWFYNYVLALACRGHIDELSQMLREKNKLQFLAPTKVEGAFKYLNRENAKDIFGFYISMYLSKYKNQLFLMARKSYSTEIMANRLEGNVLPETINRLLYKDEEFMTGYRQVNNNDFIAFYNEKLNPLLTGTGKNIRTSH
ncbi:MAG TPA: hypothetical protein DCQ31_18550 [Bacteroidales bacterium]|nr:hypothetical protein [Bacteroidales bacterium]